MWHHNGEWLVYHYETIFLILFNVWLKKKASIRACTWYSRAWKKLKAWMICKWHDHSTFHTFALPIVRSVCPPRPQRPSPPPNPKFFPNHCYQYHWGSTIVPREIEKNAYARFWGANRAYEQCENGEFTKFSSIIFWNSVLYLCCLWRLWKGPRRDRFKLPMSENTG